MSNWSVLSDEKLAILKECFAAGIKPRVAAFRANCNRLTVYKYYTAWRRGHEVGPGAKSKYSQEPNQACYVGKVPHRPCPEPNAMPWATKARLMSGK